MGNEHAVQASSPGRGELVATAIYARVSTETQEKQQTIESQLAELRRYAEAHDLAISREFVDDGYSGSRLERPALDALRDAARAGETDTVLCLCPDRLSRNFVHLALLLEDFGKRGVRVLFANQQVEDTPEGKLLLQIQGAVAEYERTKILDRSRRGRKHLARQGIMPANKTPYGYDYHGNSAERWQINEAEVVREMYRVFLEGESTIRGLAQELTRRGIVTKHGKRVWAPSTVRNILANEAYTGTAYYFKTSPAVPERHKEHRAYRRTEKTTQQKRARSEWIAVPVPPIVDRGTWERAQAQLEENKRLCARNNNKNRYLLRGLLRCRVCGHAWAGGPNKDRTYYFCGASKSHSLYTGDKCRARAVRTERIEPVVWDTVKGLLSNPDLLVEQYHVQRGREVAREADAGKRRRKLEQDLEKLGAEEMRVVRLFREGKIDGALLEAQLTEVRGKRDRVAAELEACRNAVRESALAADAEQGIREFCAEVQAGLEGATFEERQKVLRLVVDRIEVEPDGDSGTLYGILPLPREDMVLCPREERIVESIRFCYFPLRTSHFRFLLWYTSI